MQYIAHVKWFLNTTMQPVAELSPNEWVAVITGVIAVAILFWAIGVSGTYNRLNKKLDRKLRPYSYLVPLIVRYSTGLLLIVNAAKGLLFAPNITTSDVANGVFLSFLLAVAGLFLIAGKGIRTAALLMLFVYALSVITIKPVVDVLDHVEYVGIGLYLYLMHNAAYAKFLVRNKLTRFASPSALLRIFIGIGLMTLALSEKLIGINNSANFLIEHHWNFLSFTGLDDRNFIIISGITEFVVGLTLVLNIVPRLTTAVVVVLMSITAYILGIDEVFGHLFALSLVAIVWINPAEPKTVAAAEISHAITSKKTTLAPKNPTVKAPASKNKTKKNPVKTASKPSTAKKTATAKKKSISKK